MKKIILIIVLGLIADALKAQGLLENSHSQKNAKTATDYYSWFNENRYDTTTIKINYSNWWENEKKYTPQVKTVVIKGKKISKEVSPQESYAMLKTILNNELKSNIQEEIKYDAPFFDECKIKIEETKKELAELNKDLDALKKVADSPKISVREKLLLTSFHQSLVKDKDIIQQFNSSFEDKKDSLNVLLESLKKFNPDTITLFVSYTNIDSLSKENSKMLTGLKLRIGIVLNEIKEGKIKIKTRLDELAKASEIKAPKDDNVSTLPFINSIPGIKSISGSISVFGQNTINLAKTSLYAEYGGFVGTNGNTDQQNLNSLFIPEASTYAFFIKSSWGFDLSSATERNGRLGLNLNFYYAGKKLITDTAKDKKGFDVSLFQMKTGFEFQIFRDLMSIYGNINALTIGNNVEQFEKTVGNTKKVRGFIDWGVKMLLDPNKNLDLGNFKLFFDLNFLINGGDLRSINKSTDLIVPNIRFGVRKGFRI
ncbi:hypothetical protein [Ferruginibacter sp.]|nr:hypothetical protein [Ferruginibacter sp.]